MPRSLFAQALRTWFGYRVHLQRAVVVVTCGARCSHDVGKCRLWNLRHKSVAIILVSHIFFVTKDNPICSRKVSHPLIFTCTLSLIHTPSHVLLYVQYIPAMGNFNLFSFSSNYFIYFLFNLDRLEQTIR